MTYKTRLILIFLFASLLPMLMLQIYIVGRYSRQQREKVSVLISDNLTQKKNNLMQEMADYRNLIFFLMTEDSFTENIHRVIQAGPDQRAFLVSNLEATLSSKTYQKKGLQGIVYYSPEDELLVSYNRSRIKASEIFDSLGGRSAVIESIEQNNGGISMFPTALMRDQAHKNRSIIMMGSRFSDLIRTEWRGYVFLLIDEEGIHRLLNPESPGDKEIFSYTFLRDAGGGIGSFKDKEVFSLSGVEALEDEVLFRMNYPQPQPQGELITRRISVDKVGWTLVTVFRGEELYGDVSFFRLYTILIGLLATLLTVYVIRKYVLYIADTVLKLRSSLTIENDQLHFSIDEDNELDYLNRSFELMKERIDDLLTDQRERGLRLIRAQEDRRQAEIMAIEAQVNPHFLYNTLNSLNWMALERQDFEMSRALTDLADILRYSISRIDTLTTVREEMEWLERYLSLQKLRFEDLFDYKIHWDEGISDFKIYKLLFQPYVENAIIHGFQGLERTGNLDIRLRKSSDDMLQIMIGDNGKGFVPGTAGKESVGMESSSYRMKLYYRGDAKVSCHSEPGVGTTVTLSIPEIDIETVDN